MKSPYPSKIIYIRLHTDLVKRLEIVAAKEIEQALQKAEKDDKELYELIHMLIDQVVVHARPRNEKDSIAGRKKEDQLVPEKIDIQLNLPQHLIQQLFVDKFVVKNDNLYAQRDSNPRPCR